MPSTRLKLLAGLVVGFGLLQILFEDVIVFLEATGTLPAGVAGSPYVMVAIPLFISVSLTVILVGAALWGGDAFP